MTLAGKAIEWWLTTLGLSYVLLVAVNWTLDAIERYRIRRAFRNYPRGWTRINHKEPRA
jgi:hypothetical protein